MNDDDGPSEMDVTTYNEDDMLDHKLLDKVSNKYEALFKTHKSMVSFRSPSMQSRNHGD